MIKHCDIVALYEPTARARDKAAVWGGAPSMESSGELRAGSRRNSEEQLLARAPSPPKRRNSLPIHDRLQQQHPHVDALCQGDNKRRVAKAKGDKHPAIVLPERANAGSSPGQFAVHHTQQDKMIRRRFHVVELLRRFMATLLKRTPFSTTQKRLPSRRHGALVDRNQWSSSRRHHHPSQKHHPTTAPHRNRAAPAARSATSARHNDVLYRCSSSPAPSAPMSLPCTFNSGTTACASGGGAQKTSAWTLPTSPTPPPPASR